MNGIGAPVPRSEDNRLLKGEGIFSDDIGKPNQLYAVMVRSEYAHAVLLSISFAKAKSMPGVVEVLSGDDWLSDGLKPMPAWGNPKDVELKNRDGAEIFYTPLFPIVLDRIRRVGEVLAVVVAKTEAQARDAAETIEINCNVLESVTDGVSALKSGSPQLWHEVPNNLSVDDIKGDRDECDEIFSRAQHIISLETFNQRVTGVPMEPRAAVGVYDPETDSFKLEAGGQGVIRFRNELSATFGVETERMHVVSHDVGGGYGTRNHTYPEFALVLWASKKTCRPVKWVCDRSEAFISDYAGRDLVTKAELAINAEGKFLALRTENIANLGTHTVSFVPLARGPTVYNGVYDIAGGYAVSRGVLTNTTATASYRGAGRPESMFVIERLIDMAAREIGIDRIDLRRLNMIPECSLPYTNAFDVTYDSGKFSLSMERAMQLIDWEGFSNRKILARKKGRLLGIGLANYIETATGYPQERAEMEILPSGYVDLVIGTQSSGQGHETTYAQVVSEWLGVPFETIVLRTGDTNFVSAGSGSHSSRSMRLAGHLYRQTVDEIIARGIEIAAIAMEVSSDDITFSKGKFCVKGTDRAITLFDTAGVAIDNNVPEKLRGPLKAFAEINDSLPTYPNGCHACEVEIDPETGSVKILRYSGVDDVGRIINPLVVDGQCHGGIAQGVGQAIQEECVYDGLTGQLLAGSFMDYGMPRADEFPFFLLENNEVPATNTFLGVKGGGEGGTTAAPPAMINAIVDALSEFGVGHIDMPATPQKIWSFIKNSTAKNI